MTKVSLSSERAGGFGDGDIFVGAFQRDNGVGAFCRGLLRLNPRKLGRVSAQPLSAATTYEVVRKCSGDLLPPSPPGDETAACQDQAGQSSTGDGTGNYRGIDGGQKYVARAGKPGSVKCRHI